MSTFTSTLSKDKLPAASSDHHFITAVSSGLISEHQFNTWLVQNYVLVNSYVHYAAYILAKAPRWCYTVLIKGLVALDNELTWLETQLQERGLIDDKIFEPLPANLAFQQFLAEIVKRTNFFGLITTYYALELCHYEAWRSINNKEYEQFSSRSTSEESEQLIQQLKSVVDIQSSLASEDDKKEAQSLWDEVMQYASGFLDMAYNYEPGRR